MELHRQLHQQGTALLNLHVQLPNRLFFGNNMLRIWLLYLPWRQPWPQWHCDLYVRAHVVGYQLHAVTPRCDCTMWADSDEHHA